MSEFANKLLPRVRITLRVTTEEFDDEIKSYIETCATDLQTAGILAFYFDASRLDWEVDPQILQAVRWYCLSVFGLYNTDMEKYAAAYASLKSTLATQNKYHRDYSQPSGPEENQKLEEIKTKLESLIEASKSQSEKIESLDTAVKENAESLVNKLDKTTEANKIYGTDANGNQMVYNVTTGQWDSGIPLKLGGGYIATPNPVSDWHGSNKGYTDRKDNEVKAYADSRINPLEERVTDLENLTLSYSEDISIDYEKPVPTDVGKPALVKMIGGATEKVITKNVFKPEYITPQSDNVSVEYNGDTVVINSTLSIVIFDIPFEYFGSVGEYRYYIEGLENSDIVYTEPDGEGTPSYMAIRLVESNADAGIYRELRVMVYKNESVTTDLYDIYKAPEGTVFEPYHEPYFQDAEVERVESIGADGETLLGSITIPFEAIKAKIDGFGEMVNNTYYDYIEFVDDKVFGYKVADEIVLNGTEAWQNNGSVTSENNYFLTIVTSDKTKYIKDQALSNRYDYCKLTSSNKDTGINGYVSNAFGGFAVGVRPPNVTSYNPTSFKAFVKENPITVRLALATPEVTDITDLFTEGNKLQVQQGGAIRFVNEKKMAIPNTVAFIKRKE